MKMRRHTFKDGSQVIEFEGGWIIAESADAAKNLPHIIQREAGPRSEADAPEEVVEEPSPSPPRPPVGNVDYW